MKKYPKMLYKNGGNVEIDGNYFHTTIVENLELEEKVIEDGWKHKPVVGDGLDNEFKMIKENKEMKAKIAAYEAAEKEALKEQEQEQEEVVEEVEEIEEVEEVEEIEEIEEVEEIEEAELFEEPVEEEEVENPAPKRGRPKKAGK